MGADARDEGGRKAAAMQQNHYPDCPICGYRHSRADAGGHRTEKPCDTCHETKPLAAFPPASGSWDGHRHTCADCLAPIVQAAQERAQRERAERLARVTDDAPKAGSAMSTPASPYGAFASMSPAEIAGWARSALARPSLRILDTETTGHGPPWDNERCEIVEICIVDAEGMPLLDALVRPDGRMHPDAAAKSGITDALLADAPRFSALAERVVEELRDKDVVIYNARYDDPLLRESLRACGHAEPEYTVRCAMQGYMAFRGHRRRGYGLAAACSDEGIAVTDAHRALGDCLATLALLRRMAARVPAR
jgi:DNA polymerase-3 subunit epsilon